MPRSARIVIPGVPHHVVQRGNRRQTVFFNDEDREYYRDLLSHYTKKLGVYVLSYCLMENHVHQLLVPPTEDALHKVMKPVHMQYSLRINQRNEWNGHLWQQRFYSSPVDADYFWVALRYIEQNPVKAGLVRHPAEYCWSSAAAHCGFKDDSLLFLSQHWGEELNGIRSWHEWLEEEEAITRTTKLQASTKRDHPCGSDGFVSDIETQVGRPARPARMGRPRETEKK